MRFNKPFWIKLLGNEQAFKADHLAAAIRKRILQPEYPIKKPIFIWTTGRSGSYLFYDFVSQHEAIICRRNFTRFNKGIYGFENYGEADTLDLKYAFPPVEGKDPFILKSFPNLKHGKITASDLRQDVLKGVRFNYQDFFNRFGGFDKRFLDKAPQYTFLFPIIHALFPDARHCFFVRNPIDVFYSTLRRYENQLGVFENGVWGWRPERFEVYENLDTSEIVANILIDTFVQASENIAQLGGDCCVIRYEDFLEKPQKAIDRFFEHAELPSFSIDKYERFILKDVSKKNKFGFLSEGTAKRLLAIGAAFRY